MSTLASPSPSLQVPRAQNPSGSVTRSLLTTGFVVPLVAGPLLMCGLLAPKFAEIFKDFGLALSFLSRFFLNLGMALATPIGLLAAMMAVGVVTGAASLGSYRRRAWTVLALVVAILFFALFAATFMVAMYEPLVRLIESLQAKP